MVRNTGRATTRRTGLNSAARRMLVEQRSQASHRRIVVCAAAVGIVFGLTLVFGHPPKVEKIDANPGPAIVSEDANPVSDWLGSERSRDRLDAAVNKMANSPR